MKFKKGGKIAIYGWGNGEQWHERLVAVVNDIQANPPRVIAFSSGVDEVIVALPQQCRRLKPKRTPREFWVLTRMHGYPLAFTDKTGGEGIVGVTEKIHVREVMPKRKAVLGVYKK